MHQYIKFILFWNDTLHVSDGLSVHHQEFNIVHTETKQILLSACYQADSNVWQIPVAVSSVLNS